jgi:RNA polymerase sigma-70 factor (ECF subfamily)
VNKQAPETVTTSETVHSLLQQAREGDIEAFCKAFEAHRSLVTAVASRLVGRSDAEDVAMETFLKAWQGLPALRGDRGLRSWLCRIARNSALDMIRARNRRREWVPESDDGRDGDELERLADANAVGPDEALARTEDEMAVVRALSGLSGSHRTAVELRYADGLSYGEIAAATGVSIGTVMSRLFYARRKIRESVTTEGRE